jgi:anti-sigma factor RsiW
MSFYMHHVEREILSALTDGELSPEERRYVHEHLQQCEACREAAEEFAHIHGLVGELPKLIAPESFVSAALRPQRTTRGVSAARWALTGRRRWFVTGIVAAAVAITLGGLVAPEPSSEPPVDQFIARHVSVHTGAETGGQVLFAVTNR